VGTALFVSGLFFPFLSSELSTATLFDLPGTTIGIYVGLCIAVPFALAGGQRGAGIAAGALIGLTLVHVITAAAVSLAIDHVHTSQSPSDFGSKKCIWRSGSGCTSSARSWRLWRR